MAITGPSITQIQVGCQQYCSNRAPAAGPPQTGPGSGVPADLAAIEQLLSNPAVLQRLLSGPGGLQQLVSGAGGLQQLLAALVSGRQLPPGATPVGPAGAGPAAGSGQSVVDQASYQAQAGAPGTAAQTQIAIQVNSAVQPGSAVPTALPAAQADTAAGAGAGANQTLQGISQLQVGCLFDCTRTQQVQQASQSATSSVIPSTDPGSPGTVVSTATMQIWQLQIGCLFLCYATVQVQSASQQATTPPVSAGDPVSAADPASAGSGSASLAGGTPPAGSPVAGLSPVGSSTARSRVERPPTPRGTGWSPVSGGAAVAPSHSVAVGMPRPATIDAWLPVGADPVVDPVTSAVDVGAPSDGTPGDRAMAAGLRSEEEKNDVPLPRVVVMPAHVSDPVLPARPDVTPDPLLLGLGAAGLVLLAAFLISVLRGAVARRG